MMVCNMRMQTARCYKDKHHDQHFLAGTNIHTSKDLVKSVGKEQRTTNAVLTGLSASNRTGL